MKLRQLEYFLVLAQELHFGKAAERLHRSQPPVSRQIRALEETLGVDLFVRDTRNVELTAAGKTFLKEIQPALTQIENAITAAQRAAAGDIGQLNIGMTGSIMFGIMPRVLREFRRQNPGITLNIHLAPKAEQLNALKDKRLMVGLTRSLTADPTLTQDILLDEPLVVAMGPSNPLAARAQIDFSELANEDFILYRGRAPVSIADKVIDACHRSGFSPNIIQETDDMQSAAVLASLGIGITLIAYSLQQLGVPDLVCRPVVLEGKLVTIPLYAVYPTQECGPELSSFLSLAASMCKGQTDNQRIDNHPSFNP